MGEPEISASSLHGTGPESLGTVVLEPGVLELPLAQMS